MYCIFTIRAPMKIIYNKIIPFGKNFLAINLFGILFAKGYCSPRTINHEKIHTAQMREMLFIFFYIWYLAEWLIRCILYRNSFRAYLNISFEREAYANDGDLNYLTSRRHFSFIRYLKNFN